MKTVTKCCWMMALILCVFFVVCTAYAQDASSEALNTISGTAIVDNTYLGLLHFADLHRSEKLVCRDDAVTIDASVSGGIVIRGANEARILLDEEFDFGSARIQRIMINGLGKKDCITKVNVYLDGGEEPVASISLHPQDRAGVWKQGIKNVNEIVFERNITGKHSVEISVCQYLEDGTPIGDEETQAFLESIQFVAETIPLINIRIDESRGTIADMNNDETHNTKCTGAFDIIVSDDYSGDYSEINPSGTYEMKFIRGRGNSTWTSGLRLPYKIKLSAPADLFGMGNNTNWALLANAYDNDLIRNAFTYKIGEELGMSYTPQCVCVDVVMNGEYLGNYLLCENIRVGAGRIEIDDLDLEPNADNITGGYLIGTGEWGIDADAYVFKTAHGAVFNVNSPCNAQNPAYMAEMEYIVSYMQRVENALYGEPDPETGIVEDPFDLMDLDSAVKYYWVQEISANGDFYTTGSTYCYKERDGKLYWGPIWDFDIAWSEEEMTADHWKNRIGWFQVMLSNDTFAEAAEEYYKTTLKPLLDEMLSADGYCERYYDGIRYSALYV